MATVGIVSDVHMRNQDHGAVTDALNTITDRFRQKDVAHVMVLGDLIEHESTADEDLHNIERVKSAFADLEAPVTYTVGNHDVENLSPKALSVALGNRLYGTERLGDTTLVYLDSSAPHIPGAPGMVSQRQLAFLDDALHRADTAYLCIHHPVHYRDLADTYWWDRYPERALCINKKEINAILADHDSVRGVINGHIHENYTCQDNGLTHVTMNAVNKETRESGITGTHGILDTDESTLTVFDVDDEVADHSFS